ncbi:hypothetical protein BD779DRAFT_1564122, partial [Infundibulicybe gibba]
MKYFAIISALFASQVMGAVVRDTAVTCPSSLVVHLLVLDLSLSVSGTCATGLVCCQSNTNASGTGSGGILGGQSLLRVARACACVNATASCPPHHL